MNRVTSWFRRHLADPQVVSLTIIVAVLVLTVYVAGDSLAPVFAAIVIAYLLEGLVVRLNRFGLPRMFSMHVVFLGFVAMLVLAVFGLMPLLARQLTQLAQQIPSILSKSRALLMELPGRYPTVVTEESVTRFMSGLGSEFGNLGQTVVSYSFSSVVTIFTVVVYLILVPLLVYFMIKDKSRILAWFSTFLPQERQLSTAVWAEVNKQIGKYVRGKVVEILIVGVTSVVVFRLLDLQYALLLGAVTGLSVLIPYIGAAVVTLPVALVAFAQWGVGVDFYWAVVAYLIIQALDGNLLAPLLFSEAVDLHPVAIIVAILFFGGIWGFWGVFFAIPLATVIQALLQAWPRSAAAKADTPAGA